MQAAVVKNAGELAVCDVPAPEMGPYEARCELLYGTVCAGTDTHLVHGHPPFCHWMKPPFILGHESIGRVVATGNKVRHLKVGDAVTRVGCPPVDGVGSGWGGFAELGIATDWRAMAEDGLEGWQDKTVQQVLPAVVEPAVGTLFITWRETLSYVTRMGVGAGCSVLVVGSGGNGLAFASHARNLGAAAVAMVGANRRASVAERAGVTAFYDYRADDCWEQVTTQQPDGFDFVIDAVGKAEIVVQGQRALKAGGTLGIYGMDEADQLKLDPQAARGSFTFYNDGYDEAEAHDAVLASLQAGELDPAVWLDRNKVYALADITDALQAVQDRTQIKPLVRLSKA